MTPPPDRPGPLPDGFVVRLARSVRQVDGGGTLVGGAPTRALYLTVQARNLLHRRTVRVDGPAAATLAGVLLDAGMADPVLDELAEPSDAGLTVVVPAYRRADTLDRLLRGIGGRLPVVVVDDGSPDGSAIAAAAGANGASLIVSPINEGPAGARNAGLRAVRTPFVAFVDSDMVVDPSSLLTLLRHFSDERVAVVGPRVLGLGEEGANWIERYEDARSSLDMGDFPSAVRPRSPLSWLPAACMVARVAALGDGFGAGMRVAEDVDLVWRLHRQGWRVRYEPGVLVRHEHRARLVDWLGRKAFYGTGADLLDRRHPGDVAPAVLAPWSAAMLLALLAQRRWSLPVALGLTATAALRISGKVRRSSRPRRLGVRLAGAGAVTAAFQGVALLLRHWWPVTLVASLFSLRMRRAALVAAVVDTGIEYSRTRPRLDPLRFALLRRLDDLAYGAGVWWGAIRGRSPAALLPVISTGRGRGARSIRE